MLDQVQEDGEGFHKEIIFKHTNSFFQFLLASIRSIVSILIFLILKYSNISNILF